jgi:two-component system cell cycle sensor histidine kinase/response regulator CckA
MGTPLRVLIVEDSEEDTLLIVRELKRGGFDPTFERVETPEAMKTALEKQTWDLILADYSMPHFSGLDALKLLQKCGLDIPFIIVSGSIGEDTAVAAMKAGAHDYIMKNNLKRLVPAVEQELREADVRRKLKGTEEALSVSEERYRTIFEGAAEGILVADIESKEFKFANPAICRLLGYTVKELTRLNVADIHPKEALSYVVAEFEAQSCGEKTLSPEILCLRKDGTVIYTSIATAPVVIGDRKYNVGFFMDITERKKGEERMRLQSAALEAVANAIIITDREGMIEWANPAFTALTGYSHTEILGRNPRELVKSGEQNQAFYKDLWDTILAGKVWRGQIINRRKDHNLYTEEMTITPLRNERGEISRFIAIKQDITDRKRAEEELRRSEEEARQLSRENAVMAEIGRIISSTLNIEEVYERFAEEVRKLIPFDRIAINLVNFQENTIITSYVAGLAVPGREPGDVFPLAGTVAEEVIRAGQGLLIQEDRDELVRRYPRLLAMFDAGLKSFVITPLTSKDKVIGIVHFQSSRPEVYTGMDLKLAQRVSNQISGAIANAQLFLERQRVEEALRRSEEQLRQSQRMEAIGRLAGGIAHDFNNLLTVIKGYSQLSLGELREGDPLKGNIEEIKKAAERAADLTRQLLAFSRRQILEMKVLDLNTVLQNLEKMLHRLIGEDIELVFLKGKDLGTVKCDPGQIEQVIMNLAVNARDAMPKGGKLTVETANVELDDAYARAHIAVRPGRYVMFSVSDTGIGMTPEVRERVFEPFFTTKERGKGTGLGLSTVYGIVKQSGGNIWVYSEPGKGTAFKIYLPRVDEPLEELEEEVRKKGFAGGIETIFIVEDNEEVRKLAKRILAKQGYKVLEASQGNEALQICEKHKGPIHLMVTDVVMPGMDGHELANSLKIHHPETKVLYMSGYTDNAITHHGILEKGMNYVQKPFTVDGLLKKVREVLDK